MVIGQKVVSRGVFVAFWGGAFPVRFVTGVEREREREIYFVISLQHVFARLCPAQASRAHQHRSEVL